MLRLRVKAPFAAFRPLVAGDYRPTAPFMPPSAAYGLVLNLAGIESRGDDDKLGTTLMAKGLDKVDIALGAVVLPEVQAIYQQLHNYPVDKSGREEGLRRCKFAKYNIQPIRREYLSNFDAYVCLRGNDKLEGLVRTGLRDGTSSGQTNGRLRYGIPFLGDNSFMADVIREEEPPEKPAFWYERVDPKTAEPTQSRIRQTVWVDRENAANTQKWAKLYAVALEAAADPPDSAWTLICPPDAKDD